MPVIKNAVKALRQARKRTVLNNNRKVGLRVEVRKYKKQKDVQSLAKVYSLVDKMVKKHLIHKNKGKRLKSQMALLAKKTSA